MTKSKNLTKKSKTVISVVAVILVIVIAFLAI